MVKYFGLLLFTAAYKKKVMMAHFHLNLYIALLSKLNDKFWIMLRKPTLMNPGSQIKTLLEFGNISFHMVKHKRTLTTTECGIVKEYRECKFFSHATESQGSHFRQTTFLFSNILSFFYKETAT